MQRSSGQYQRAICTPKRPTEKGPKPTRWVGSFILLILLLGSVSADTITSSTGTLYSFPTDFRSSTPSWGSSVHQSSAPAEFWNNTSYDSQDGDHQMNIGDLLTTTHGASTMPTILSGDSVSTSLMTAPGTEPPSFGLVRAASAYQISIPVCESSLDTGNATVGTVFGSYVGDNVYPHIRCRRDEQSHTGPKALNPTAPDRFMGFMPLSAMPSGCAKHTLLAMGIGATNRVERGGITLRSFNWHRELMLLDLKIPTGYLPKAQAIITT